MRGKGTTQEERKKTGKDRMEDRESQRGGEREREENTHKKANRRL